MIISKNDIKTLSAKSVKERAKREASKAIDNARAQVMNLEPMAIETAKNQVSEALDKCKEAIDQRIKEETGYTLQEARYLTIEAYKKAKEAVANKDNIVKNLGKEMKVKKPESLEEIVKKMPDDLYNAFFLNEILEAIDKAKTVAAQTRDLGTKAIDEVVDHINFIKENFKGEGTDSIIKKSEEIKSTIDISNEEKSLNNELVSELGKSKLSTSGKEYDFSDKKKLAKVAKTALQGLLGLLPVLEILKHLIDNYRTNKNGLREDSAERINDLFESSASGDKIKSSEILMPLSSARESEKEEKSNLIELDLNKVNMTSDSKNAYVTKNPNIVSELDRVYSSLSSAIKNCKYNPKFPLVNKSSLTSGGQVENLKHAGNNKNELIDAIEALEPIKNR